MTKVVCIRIHKFMRRGKSLLKRERGGGTLNEMQLMDIIRKNGGSAWESNPPARVLARHTGFEVREPHQ